MSDLEQQLKNLGDLYHKRGNEIAWLNRQAKRTPKILKEVLGGGMLIGRDPDGHGWQLLAWSTGDFREPVGEPEIVAQHEDWDTFLGLCEEYVS